MTYVSASVVEYAPSKVYTVVGQTKDMTLHGNTLLIATGSGAVHIYDITSDVEVKRIELEKVKDFMGDLNAPKIFAVDKDEQRYLLLSDSGSGGYTNLWIHEDNKTKNILNASHKIAALKARFVDNKHVLLGLLSNEAVLVDIEAQKVLYTVQLEPSKFSDFTLNEDRTKAVFACESGILSMIDTLTGKEIKKLKGVNVDNVYKVDFKNGIVSAAGQDRRGGLYDTDLGMQTYIEGSFLIYATALSPTAKKVAFTMDEKNTISVYNRSTKQKIAELKGQKSTLNTILFKDENTLFTASDDNSVMVWKIK
jgi:WD40 repeat protein